MKSLLRVTCAALLAIGSVSAVIAADAKSIPSNIAAAVANADRPDEDRQRDAERKPAEVLAFAGVKPGYKVVDFSPGAGYFSRLLSGAVGPTGHVYGFFPIEFPNFTRRLIPPDHSAPYPKFPNFTVISTNINQLIVYEPIDVVWLSQNYHDLHNVSSANLLTINKAVFQALKPGGLYIVIDHAAQEGSGVRDTNTLHRIDEATVKAEVKAAGFKFVEESDLLHNADDPRTASVIDPSIRGKTDQFILKFRKPKQ